MILNMLLHSYTWSGPIAAYLPEFFYNFLAPFFFELRLLSHMIHFENGRFRDLLKGISSAGVAAENEPVLPQCLVLASDPEPSSHRMAYSLSL